MDTKTEPTRDIDGTYEESTVYVDASQGHIPVD